MDGSWNHEDVAPDASVLKLMSLGVHLGQTSRLLIRQQKLFIGSSENMLSNTPHHAATCKSDASLMDTFRFEIASGKDR